MRWVFLCVGAALLAAANVWAEGPPSTPIPNQSVLRDPFPQYDSPPRTRLEQISRVKKRLEILEDMSDQQWFALRDQQLRNQKQNAKPPSAPAH